MPINNTTQNKEELSKEVEERFDKQFYYVPKNDEEAIACTGFHANQIKQFLAKELSQAHQSGIEEGARAERVKIAKLLGDEYENMENNASFYLKLAESLKENKQ